jgi:hypothetical protein
MLILGWQMEGFAVKTATSMSVLAFVCTLGLGAVAQAQTQSDTQSPPQSDRDSGYRDPGYGDQGYAGPGYRGAAAPDTGYRDAAPRYTPYRAPAATPARPPIQDSVRLRALHDALNIRPDQEQAFAAVAAAMSANEGSMRADMIRQRQSLSSMTTPQRLDAIGRMMDDHMDRMRQQFQNRADSLKALYAVLSPEQRHTLDALPGLMGHHGMGLGPSGDMDMGPPGGMDGHGDD